MLSKVSTTFSKPFSTCGFSTGIHSNIAIIGAGSAGVNVCSQLLREGVLRQQIRIFDSSKLHYYQPGWTMVGGGICKPSQVVSSTSSMIPKGVPAVAENIAEIDPDNNALYSDGGAKFTYDHLIIATGIENNYDAIPGNNLIF